MLLHSTFILEAPAAAALCKRNEEQLDFRVIILFDASGEKQIDASLA